MAKVIILIGVWLVLGATILGMMQNRSQQQSLERAAEEIRKLTIERDTWKGFAEGRITITIEPKETATY